jgi:hypothetical protein
MRYAENIRYSRNFMQNQVVKLLIYDLFFFKEAFLGVFLLLCRQKKTTA